MFKKFLAGLTVFALSLGMVALTAGPASAHLGSITASAVCNPQTGQYDVTYKLSWSSVPSGVHADLYTRTGTTSFASNWTFGTWNDWTDRGDSTGASGFISWTESLPGNTVGNGPWVYAYTAWSNGYGGSTRHDTRIENLQGGCLGGTTPATPTFVDAVCVVDGPGTVNGYYVVNGTPGDHVHYEVSTNSTNGVDGTWSPISDGPHDGVVGVTYWIKAVPDAGYQLVGTDVGPWHHTFAAPDTDCLDRAAAGDPVFVDEICTVDGIGTDAGYYTVIAGENVSYEVSTDSTDGIDGTWAPVDPSTYGDQIATSPGDHVWVRATALSGYKLAADATRIWDHTFPAAADCLDDTPVRPAIVVNQICVVDDSGHGSYTSGSITPPTGTPHVTYYVGAVDGEFVDAAPLTAEKPFAPGSYKVWALADEGYQLVGEGGYIVNDPNAPVIQDGQLAYEIVTVLVAEACGDLIEHPTITPTVTFTQQTCAAAGSYTLGVEEEDSFQGIIWTITPSLPTTEGTHEAPAGAAHITASPADGYGFTGVVPLVNGIPTPTWDFVFELPDGCLPTLALTGGSIANGALAFSAFLTLAGFVLITTRRRVA